MIGQTTSSSGPCGVSRVVGLDPPGRDGTSRPSRHRTPYGQRRGAPRICPGGHPSPARVRTSRFPTPTTPRDPDRGWTGGSRATETALRTATRTWCSGHVSSYRWSSYRKVSTTSPKTPPFVSSPCTPVGVCGGNPCRWGSLRSLVRPLHTTAGDTGTSGVEGEDFRGREGNTRRVLVSETGCAEG